MLFIAVLVFVLSLFIIMLLGASKTISRSGTGFFAIYAQYILLLDIGTSYLLACLVIHGLFYKTYQFNFLVPYIGVMLLGVPIFCIIFDKVYRARQIKLRHKNSLITCIFTLVMVMLTLVVSFIH